MARAASLTPPQLPFGGETLGNTTTLGQPDPRLKRKHGQRPTYKGVFDSLEASSSKVKTLTKETPNLQGCNRNDNVNNNVNKEQQEGIEPATSSVMKPRRNQINHPVFPKKKKKKDNGNREPW